MLASCDEPVPRVEAPTSRDPPAQRDLPDDPLSERRLTLLEQRRDLLGEMQGARRVRQESWVAIDAAQDRLNEAALLLSQLSSAPAGEQGNRRQIIKDVLDDAERDLEVARAGIGL